jgi:hypothetical protein
MPMERDIQIIITLRSAAAATITRRTLSATLDVLLEAATQASTTTNLGGKGAFILALLLVDCTVDSVYLNKDITSTTSLDPKAIKTCATMVNPRKELRVSSRKRLSPINHFSNSVWNLTFSSFVSHFAQKIFNYGQSECSSVSMVVALADSRHICGREEARNGNRFALNFYTVMASFIHLNAMGNRVRQVREPPCVN